MNSISNPQPRYSIDNRAYFDFSRGTNSELYVFDGTSFDFVLSAPLFSIEFFEVGDRVFVNASQLFEIVNYELVPVGIRLDDMFSFDGEVFGYSRTVPGPSAGTLWQLQDGALKSLGDVVNRFSDSWVEFEGQLYFGGQSGSNRQLYALVPVPEPATLPLLAIPLAFCLFARHARPRTGRFSDQPAPSHA